MYAFAFKMAKQVAFSIFVGIIIHDRMKFETRHTQ